MQLTVYAVWFLKPMAVSYSLFLTCSAERAVSPIPAIAAQGLAELPHATRQSPAGKSHDIHAQQHSEPVFGVGCVDNTYSSTRPPSCFLGLNHDVHDAKRHCALSEKYHSAVYFSPVFLVKL